MGSVYLGRNRYSWAGAPFMLQDATGVQVICVSAAKGLVEAEIDTVRGDLAGPCAVFRLLSLPDPSVLSYQIRKWAAGCGDEKLKWGQTKQEPNIFYKLSPFRLFRHFRIPPYTCLPLLISTPAGRPRSIALMDWRFPRLQHHPPSSPILRT